MSKSNSTVSAFAPKPQRLLCLQLSSGNHIAHYKYSIIKWHKIFKYISANLSFQTKKLYPSEPNFSFWAISDIFLPVCVIVKAKNSPCFHIIYTISDLLKLFMWSYSAWWGQYRSTGNRTTSTLLKISRHILSCSFYRRKANCTKHFVSTWHGTEQTTTFKVQSIQSDCISQKIKKETYFHVKLCWTNIAWELSSICSEKQRPAEHLLRVYFSDHAWYWLVPAFQTTNEQGKCII